MGSCHVLYMTESLFAIHVTLEGKAPAVWTSQLCLCDIKAMQTTWAVDLLSVLFLIALIG